METNNTTTLKFTNLNVEYKLKLVFDEPATFDGEYGKSIVYGAHYGTKEVRFYASKGLHEEIQKQGLKKGDICVIKKVKPGDFAYFIVNGKSKHLDQDEGNLTEASEAATSPDVEYVQNSPDQSLINRIEALEATVEKLCSSAEVPF